MVYRVDAATGAETLVRGVEMVGTPLSALNKIIATSDEVGVFNGYCGAESGYVPVVLPHRLCSSKRLSCNARNEKRESLHYATPLGQSSICPINELRCMEGSLSLLTAPIVIDKANERRWIG